MQPEINDACDTHANQIGDAAVLRYLMQNPEFFVTNQDVLPRLHIPHPSGKAVSLIEKQVSVLRNKCSTLEHSLRDLIDVARDNEQLNQRLHVLIQDVISARNIEDIAALTRESLKANFHADEVHFLVIGQKATKTRAKKKSAAKKKAAAGKSTVAKTTTARKAKDGVKAASNHTLMVAGDKQLDAFKDLFEKREALCGLPSTEHLDLLVGKDHANIASAAIMPLYHERELGVVMLSSRDESRFASGKGVMFLNQLGDMLSRRLHTLELIV